MGASAKVYEYLGSRTGALHLQAAFVTSASSVAFAAADANHHEKIDLLYADGLYCNAQLPVWFGNGSGGFTVGPTTALSTAATSLTVGDFDGDGRADVVAQQGLGASEHVTALVMYGDGAGHVTTGPTLFDNSNSWFSAKHQRLPRAMCSPTEPRLAVSAVPPPEAGSSL